MKITVLVENTPHGCVEGEHGLSLLVEHNSKSYLIDTGQSGLFLENAIKMNIDLSKVNMAFLSHGHYDHSGGFKDFFKVNNQATVYLQEKCREKKFYKVVDSNKTYIGIPDNLLEDYEDRFEFVDGFIEVDDGVYLCSHSLSSKNPYLYDSKLAIDDFSHEQTVIFEDNENLFLFNSCSHCGVDNIINEITEIFPEKTIKAFVGGFHLMGTNGVMSCNLSEREVKNLGNSILGNSKAIFYTGHCTGNLPFKWLKELSEERFIKIHSGMEIYF